MLLKERAIPAELKAMRSLNTRMNLSANEKARLKNLEKGYQGEIMFDQLSEKLQSEVFILNDLCLEHNNSIFQIDTLIISKDTHYLIEVKNFEGDFYYENDSFFSLNKTELKNPLDQLKRCKLLFSQLLQSQGYHVNIEGYVVFINPEFTLYQAPINEPIIYPTQINRFMKKLNQKPSKLNEIHKRQADKLISQHQISQPRLPPYQYDQLIKGIFCSECHTSISHVSVKNVKCHICGHEESVETAILRCVEELKRLFPDIKLTTKVVFEWCRVIESKKQITRILKENFNVIGYGKWTYFE